MAIYRNKKWLAAVGQIERCVLCGAWGTDEIGTLKSQLQANAESDLKTKRDAVKAKFSFMTEAAINSLTGEALNDMYSQCQTSTGLNPSFQQVNAENDQWKDYDLNAGMDDALNV